MVSSASRMVMTLLGTGVSALILSATSSPAAAQNVFSPNGSWNINRIDPQNGSASYCTLARKFTGNLVITFARNTGGEGTIAIDFNQSLFDPKQSYRIGLQAGEGIKREFVTRPATAGALVLRTGEDAKFFEALGQSTELGVIMDGNRYAFSLPDFGDGVSQLANCISVSGGAVVKSPTARASAPVTSAVAEASPELRAMRAELDKLRSENDAIVTALKSESSTRAAPTATREDAQLVARVQALETEKNQLVERLQSSQTQDLRDVSELRVALEEQKNLRNLLQAERQQRESLERSLKEETAVAEQRGELRARINLLESSNNELKTLRASLDAERKKREAAEASAALGLEEQERLRARLTQLETQNQSLVQDAARFATVKSELEDVSKLAEQERARREATEAALQTSQMTIAQREAELANLQSRLNDERSKLDNAQKTQQDTITRDHEAAVNRLQAQIATLQDAQEQALNEQARRAAAENTVREMQVQVSDLQKQLVSARENKQSQGEVASLQKRISELQAAQSEAVGEAARRAAAENTVREMQAQMADLQKQVSGAKDNTQAAALRSELDAVRQNYQEAQSRLETETARRIAGEQTIASLQKQMATPDNSQTGKLASRLAAMEEHNNDLMKRLRETQQSSPDNKAELQELRTLLETETARRAAAESAFGTASNAGERNAILDKRIAELEARNNELTARLKTAPAAQDNAQIDALRAQLNVLHKDNEQLATRLAKVVSEPAPSVVPAGKVVYTGGDQAMAETLAETQSSLEAAMAERNEYRNLLQRERAQQTVAGNAAITSSGGASNKRIVELEAERVDLIRQLEFERSRLSQVASGNEAPPSAVEARLNERLASLAAEKANLEKQLRITQQDVLDARNAARTPSSDVIALLEENRRLQAELTDSSKRPASGNASADISALQGEIATLRAQNEMLNSEVSRRLAAAPDRAQIDNANARAQHAAQNVQTQMAGEVSKAQARFEQAEAENIRLARELAAARTASAAKATVAQPSAPVAQQTAPQPPVVVATTQRTAAVSRPIIDTPTDAPYGQASTYQQHTSVSVPAAPVAPQTDAYIANKGPDGRMISSYLQRAGIPMVSGFEKISRVSTDDFSAFRWDTGVVFGTAEQKLAHASGVDAAMNEYLQKTRNRCSGSYDQSIGKIGNIVTADVACIMPDGNGAGAAVAFFYKDGLFNIVAHEGTLDSFEQAMTTRDRLATFLQGNM